MFGTRGLSAPSRSPEDIFSEMKNGSGACGRQRDKTPGQAALPVMLRSVPPYRITKGSGIGSSLVRSQTAFTLV